MKTERNETKFDYVKRKKLVRSVHAKAILGGKLTTSFSDY